MAVIVPLAGLCLIALISRLPGTRKTFYTMLSWNRFTPHTRGDGVRDMAAQWGSCSTPQGRSVPFLARHYAAPCINMRQGQTAAGAALATLITREDGPSA